MAPASLELPRQGEENVDIDRAKYTKQEYSRYIDCDSDSDSERECKQRDDDLDMLYEQYMASKRSFHSSDVDMSSDMDLSDTEDEDSSEDNIVVEEKERTSMNDSILEAFSCSESELIGKVKELAQQRLETERDTFVFSGAIQYLEKQLQVAHSRDNLFCPVCHREYGCRVNDPKNCIEQLQAKITETKQARDEARVLELYEECIASINQMKQVCEMKGLQGSLIHVDADNGCQSRISFNVRTGALTELRNQKTECLVAKQCFGCERGFTPNESAEYLRKADHTASQMQKELHIHLS